MARFGTLAVHAGTSPDQWRCKSMWPPIVTATTYKQAEPDDHWYTEDNPTRESLEKAFATLEGAEYAFAVNSGSTASTVIMEALLKEGDDIVVSEESYYGSIMIMRDVINRGNISTSQVNVHNTEDLKSSIKRNTKLVWVDCPGNPLLTIADISKLSTIAHNNNCLLVVDSTFATPYFQRPLQFGADIVMHSVSKFLSGHGDVLMGVVCTNDRGIAEKLKCLQTTIGAVPSPFDCYLTNRSLRTLHVRMKQHALNALAVAQYLESSPLVESTIYPGLPSHPQHELAKRQLTNGFGGIVSFRIKGNLENAKKFLSSLKVFTMAVSLGGLESLAEVCTIMTRKAMNIEDQLHIGITDNLIRLSIGLEDIDDILEDLQQALQASQ